MNNYLRPRSLTVSATNGPFDKVKWIKLFTAGIDNYTGMIWDDVTSGCIRTHGHIVNGNDLIKDGKYSDFIEDLPMNFFSGIEQAFKIMEDNPSLVRGVIDGDQRIHIPFTNAKNVRFIAYVFKYNGKLNGNVSLHSSDHVWVESYCNVIILPHNAQKIKS